MKKRITLIENEYACLWYYPDDGILHHQLLQPITDEVFRTLLMTGLKYLREHGVQKWLSDDRKNSNLPAETSAWSQEYWLPRALNADWKYWAMLPPAKARGRVNVERLINDANNNNTPIRIELFKDPDEAWQWLARQGVSEED